MLLASIPLRDRVGFYSHLQKIVWSNLIGYLGRPKLYHVICHLLKSHDDLLSSLLLPLVVIPNFVRLSGGEGGDDGRRGSV